LGVHEIIREKDKMNGTSPGSSTLSRRRFLALAAGVPALALVRTPSAAAQAGASPARIAVQAGQELWRIPASVRGFNFWGTRSDAAFMPEYRKIGLGLLRFPPGQAGDQQELQGGLIEDSAKVAHAMNGDMVVEVRLRGGTPEKAAAAVVYTNFTRKYGARYWEVGNEPDEYRRRADEPNFSPDWYAERFRAYAQAMKGVDPSIKVFGPVLSNKLDAWMRPFITECGDIVDGLSWHFYGGSDKQLEAELLASPARFDRQVEQVRGWWRDPAVNPKGHTREVPLLISEYGASYVTNNPKNLTTQAAAVWTADMLGHLVTQRVDMAAYFTLWGIENHGVWDNRGKIRPVYYTFLLFNQFGSRLVRAESDQALLPAYAALREDGALSMMVVNKSPNTTYRAAIELQDFVAGASVQLWRHDKGTPGAQLSYDGPLAPLDVAFPPYSTTVLVLPPRGGLPTALLWAGAGGAALIGGILALRRRRVGQRIGSG
jgi:hypothetical protein